MRVFYDADCDLGLIKDKIVAVVGYGSQGHAHALNMKDSGVKNVWVALKAGSASAAKAEAAGLKVVTVAEAAQKADALMIVTPDEIQPELYAAEIAPYIKTGQTLMFAHGFSVHFGLIQPPKGVDVVMVAPKGPGHTVRSEYQKGGGAPFFKATRRLGDEHQIEAVGAELRGMMPWIGKNKMVDKARN